MTQAFDDITVAIVAKNAAPTIARAVRSAIEAGACSIVLIDDASTDGTVDKAHAVSNGALNIVRNPNSVSVGYVRSLALKHIETPYGIWLDADDEFGVGHLAVMRRTLAMGDADLVLGAAHLFDGRTSKALKHLELPRFMMEPASRWRSFERNWYPSLHAAFRTDFARQVDYDHAFRCVEDYDFLLRAIVAGGRLGVEPDAQYRYYHYDNTISRNRRETEIFTARAIAKHKLDDIGHQLDAAGFSPADQACILASAAQFSGDTSAVQTFAALAQKERSPVAPYDLSAAAVGAFFAGTAALIEGNFAAARLALEPLAGQGARLEVLNNLAVAFAHTGHPEQAGKMLESILVEQEGYVDARMNLEVLEAGALPGAITRHPLRVAGSRDKYSG